MKREDYENFKWYPITDNEYWVEFNQEEFPNCNTIVCKSGYNIADMRSTYLGWAIMAKDGDWYFMIIEKNFDNETDKIL